MKSAGLTFAVFLSTLFGWQPAPITAAVPESSSANAPVKATAKAKKVTKARATAQARGGSSIDQAFHKADLDKNGRLTRAEYPQKDIFDEVDTDKDGNATLEEERAYHLKKRRAEVAARGAASAEPVLVSPVEDNDAVRDAAGRGQMFERIEVANVTDEFDCGTNGLAVADLNQDGILDLVLCENVRTRRRNDGLGDRLRLLLGRGNFKFEPHEIVITGSSMTADKSQSALQIPNLVDLNGDGFLDLFITCTAAYEEGKRVKYVPEGNAPGNVVLLSQGKFDTFVDVTRQMGSTNERAYNRQSSLGDVNQDGWLDIAIGCDNIGSGFGGEPHSRLYVFKPKDEKFEDGRFEDIGDTPLIPDFGGFHNDPKKDRAGPGITLRDLDNDGDLDLVQSYHIDLRAPGLPLCPGEYRQGIFCWKNLRVETGETRFEKITGNGLHAEADLRYNQDKKLYEPASAARAPGLPYIAMADVDNDGDMDIFATGPSDRNWSPRSEYVGGRFWKNEGGFQFTEATAAAGLGGINNTYRQWFAFFDEKVSPFHKKWTPPTPGVLAQPGMPPVHPLDKRPYYADAIFGDYDNDGWLDLVVLDRREAFGVANRSMLWMNKGDGTFDCKQTSFSGLDASGITGEAADLNNDGLLDLVVGADPDNSGGATEDYRYEDKIFWNTGLHGGQGNHWLRLTFRGLSAAELIGARVELTAEGGKQTRWIHSNHSYKSGGSLNAHFGLGKAGHADVKVTLLSGKTRQFKDIQANQSHALALDRL